MNRKVLIRIIVIAGGIGILLLSLFAFQLGLDNDPGWGPLRIKLVGTGFAIILFGSLYWITPFVGQVFNLIYLRNENHGGLHTSLASDPIKKINQHDQRINIWLILSGCLVLWIYVWIITTGRIDKWPSGRNYYWMLSQAFQQGQTHLLIEPNPELANLENPYDLNQRKGLEYLWDATYYRGKYFLYWGPMPAVLGVFVSAVISKPVTDAGLVFFFVVGAAFFSVLLLKDSSKQFKIPGWAFWGGAFASMLNIPLIWLLARPSFYEVSISGGQFFLMAGFYLLFRAFSKSLPHIGLIAASALTFGLAGATRINLLPSVIFLAALILWRIYVVNDKKVSASIPAFTATLVPLAIVACCLFWYNYDRFGSIFEFGHRYQLTGPALTADYGDISSFKYILPNTFVYIFRQPALSREFPFLTISRIKQSMWPFFIRLPDHYTYNEPMAGILFVVPLIGLTVLLLMRSFWLFINDDVSRDSTTENKDTGLFSWFVLSMLAYVLIQTFILLIFLYSAMRYLFDFSPVLIVLSTIFVGYYVQAIDNKPHLARIFALVWVFASALTVIAGLLIGLTGDRNNFLNHNPQLYYKLLEWFTR